ncbi:hypothetical protein BG418_12320 [Streptomyces sp. CBMA152]|nr:hypothetical protein [Streptomyces sp. CBMA152]
MLTPARRATAVKLMGQGVSDGSSGFEEVNLATAGTPSIQQGLTSGLQGGQPPTEHATLSDL